MNSLPSDVKTISMLISELQCLKDEHGDLPVAFEDTSIGWPTSIGAMVMNSKGFNENGYYSYETGNQKVCVIGFC